ncbi:MAG: hypothetical protein LHW49_02085 [Candidatus Cloacimonetes bacterium]|nr:hypothetical protein [Candidatus Cloacimonadota bacterium]MDD2649790.1 hypothetical protein [Candidatus Cloacimonadota bacterium]
MNKQESTSFVVSESAFHHYENIDYIINCKIETVNLYIVIDQFGNIEDKGVAAQLVALTIKDKISSSEENYQQSIEKAVFAANQALIDYVTKKKYYSGIGCSSLIAIEANNYLYYTIIGNSTVFIIRDKQIQVITHKNIYPNTELKYLGNTTLKYVNVLKESLYNEDTIVLSSHSFLKQFTRIDLLKYVLSTQFDTLKVNLLTFLRQYKLKNDVSMIFIRVNNQIKKVETTQSEKHLPFIFVITLLFFLISLAFFMHTCYFLFKPYLKHFILK